MGSPRTSLTSLSMPTQMGTQRATHNRGVERKAASFEKYSMQQSLPSCFLMDGIQCSSILLSRPNGRLARILEISTSGVEANQAVRLTLNSFDPLLCPRCGITN